MDRLALIASAGLVACVGAEPAPASPPPPPRTEPEAEPLPRAPPDDPVDAGLAPALVPMAAMPAAPSPALRFDRPRAGEVIAMEAWATYTGRLDDGGWLSTSEHRVAVVLDDYRVRYVALGEPFPALRELVPVDRDLEPGSHRLFVGAVRADGRLAKTGAGRVRFWLGEAAGAPEPDSSVDIVYVEPQGTFNGSAAASAARLDFYVVGASLGPRDHRVRVFLRGPLGSRATLVDRWVAHEFEALGSGDYHVELQLLGPDDHRVTPPVARSITVNLDAPSP